MPSKRERVACGKKDGEKGEQEQPKDIPAARGGKAQTKKKGKKDCSSVEDGAKKPESNIDETEPRRRLNVSSVTDSTPSKQEHAAPIPVLGDLPVNDGTTEFAAGNAEAEAEAEETALKRKAEDLTGEALSDFLKVHIIGDVEDEFDRIERLAQLYDRDGK